MALAETAELVAELNLKGNFKTEGAKAEKTLGRLNVQSKQLRQGMDKVGKGLAQGARSIVSNGVKIGAVLTGVGVVAYKMAADFEEQLRTINTVARVSDQQLGAIGESLKTMASETGTALGDLTGAYYDLVSAGVKAADAQDILTQANTLAIGGLSTTGEAVDLLTTAINSYGLEAKDAKRITDGFAQAIADGKVTAAELAGSFADVAPFAADLGIEIEELQAGYALLTAKGVKAAQAGTYMKSAISALINPTTDLQKLQAKLNVDFAALARDRGLVYAYNELQKAADKAGIPLQKLTGRIEGAAFATNTGGRNFRSYNRELENVRRSSEGAGTAAEQMAERQRGANAALRRLRETARATAITFGDGLLPSATKGFEALGKELRKRRQQIKGFGQDIGGVLERFFSPEVPKDAKSVQEAFSLGLTAKSPFEKAVEGIGDALSKVPFDQIKGALQTGLEVTAKAAEIFNGLPDPIKQGLITLLAVNKLTGGGATVIASGLKDLAGFALKSLTTINAGNVVVNAASVGGNSGAGGATTGNKKGGGFSLFGGGLTGLLGGLALGAFGSQSDAPTAEEIAQKLGWSPAETARQKALWQAILDRNKEGNRTAEGQKTALQRATQRIQELKGRFEELRQRAGKGNDILNGIAADAQRDANNGKTMTMLGRLQANKIAGLVPVLGGVKQAVTGVTSAVNRGTLATQRQDLSVRVSVAATTVVEGVNRVTNQNRFVVS